MRSRLLPTVYFWDHDAEFGFANIKMTPQLTLSVPFPFSLGARFIQKEHLKWISPLKFIFEGYKNISHVSQKKILSYNKNLP